MMQVHHWRHAFSQHRVDHAIVKTHGIVIDGIGFQIVNQTTPLNAGTHAVHTDGTHHLNVFSVAVVKVRGGIWSYLIVKNFWFDFVMVIKYVGMFFVKTTFTLRA